MRLNRTHQPDELVSCSRRTWAASDGRKITRTIRPTPTNRADLPATMAQTKPTANPSRKLASTKYQYSDRGARPRKSAYFLKQVLTACLNPIFVPIAVPRPQVSNGSGIRKGCMAIIQAASRGFHPLAQIQGLRSHALSPRVLGQEGL